ncbi:hypothetical protein [Psychrobacillus sp. NPDC093200]
MCEFQVVHHEPNALQSPTKTYEIHAFKVQFKHPITGQMIIAEDKR